MHRRKNNLTVMHRRKCRGMGWGKDMAWDWMCRLALIPNPCWLCPVTASFDSNKPNQPRPWSTRAGDVLSYIKAHLPKGPRGDVPVYLVVQVGYATKDKKKPRP